MKGAALALDTIDGAEVAALVVDGRLEELWLAAPEPWSAPGAIHRGVVGRQAKGQGGVFVDLEGGRGFLRQAKGLAPGDAILLQVSGSAEAGKAVPVTPRLLFKSRYAIVTPGAPGLNISRAIRDEDERDRLEVLLREAVAEASPPEGAGVILRTGAVGTDREEIQADLAAMCQLADQVLGDREGGPELLVDADSPHVAAWREAPPDAAIDSGPGSFERAGVHEMIEGLLQPDVPLASGASMRIEATRAFTAVDVNTGADVSAAAGLRATIAALRELPRQMRLRGLGGQAVVDCAPFPKKDRRQVEQVLQASLRANGEGSFIGWTPLGHVELTMKRDRPPLSERWATR